MVDTNTPGRVVSPVAAKRLIYAMAAATCVFAAMLYYATYDSADFERVTWQAVVGIGILTFVCERVRIQVIIRRQTITFNLIEIPLIFTLFLLPPLVFLVFRLMMEVVSYLVDDPLPLIKRVVNLGVHVLEPALMTYIFRAFGAADPTSAKAWAVAIAAVIIADIVGLILVATAISLTQGWLANNALIRIFSSIIFTAIFNTCIAILMFICLQVNILSLALIVIIGIAIIFGYRTYTRISRQHSLLNKVHEFTKDVGTARQDGSLADSLLLRTRELLDAESATLWLPAQGRHPEVLLVAHEDTPGVVDDPHGETDALRLHVIKTGTTLVLSSQFPNSQAGLRRALQGRGIKDIIVVPLRSGTAIIGCLEVANRLGELSAFGRDEVRLLETVAAHAAVAVENARLVDRLRHDAYHDTLTGLANRRRFFSALESTLAVAPTPAEVIAVMQFEADSLRDVNETLGHGAGDRMLIEVAKRLQSQAPKGALVARLGGHEFAMLLRTKDADTAQNQAQAIQYALVQPLRLDKLTLDVRAAVGIAVCPDHGTDAAQLLRRADVAASTARHNPRPIQLYRPAMESRSMHRLSLVSELRSAVEAGELSLYYQPKISLGDRRLIGMECLVRWEHPEHGLVPPDDFIPVAEHTGLVGALTRSVLRTALAQCRHWQEQGHGLGVAVNLSLRSLHDPQFPADLDDMLREAGLSSEHLTLEVTENAMAGDIDRPLPILRRLFEMGVRLSIDDFGTGYSSLSYLRHLPVHELKIDKSFILGMTTDSSDLGIVRAIVDLSRYLGLAVVAEGVESEMTLTLLEQMGCDMAQGFLFSRPLPYERIEAWMQARTEASVSPESALRRLRILS